MKIEQRLTVSFSTFLSCWTIWTDHFLLSPSLTCNTAARGEEVRAPVDGLRLLRKSLSLSVFVCLGLCVMCGRCLWGASLLSCSWGETWAEVLGEVQQ